MKYCSKLYLKKIIFFWGYIRYERGQQTKVEHFEKRIKVSTSLLKHRKYFVQYFYFYKRLTNKYYK